MQRMKAYLRDDLAKVWQGSDPFASAEHQQGEIYRAREGRRTLRFCTPEKAYFLKYHAGIGWREIAKNLLQAKMPVFGAMTEVRAINAMKNAGIATMTIAGYGVRGFSPASQTSFIVTDELVETISLEDLGERWLQDRSAVSTLFKRELINEVAVIAGRMHRAGINHRDFYLAHFHLSQDSVSMQTIKGDIHMIDLHRTQVRKSVPQRWRVKDLGGLYFSTARYGMTRSDILRFIKAYTGLPLRKALAADAPLWQAARKEGEKIYRRYYEKEPLFPLQFNEHPGKNI